MLMTRTGSDHRADSRAGTTWVVCGRCSSLIYARKFARELHVCPECAWHTRLTAAQRLAQLLDDGSVRPLRPSTPACDHLQFTDTLPYTERLRQARHGTGLDDAVVSARGTIGGRPVVVSVMDFRFLGGSLGAAAGEQITTAAEAALEGRLPLVIVSASGGARMQEGVISLMQMAKTSQALAALDEAGLVTISVVTDPTYGGVAASFATQCDVIIAEPGARMGFAGPRVISETTRQKLPANFQTAEALLAQGLIDGIEPRAALRPALRRLLAFGRQPPSDWRPAAADRLIRDASALSERDPWATVQLARHPGRPTTLDYLAYVLDEFTELRGDRASGDCPALVGGLGQIDGLPVVVIGHQKGHATHELVARNFGMARPAGYRKAARLMKLAAKTGAPVITLIDTPGADPRVEAEEQGQAIAVAGNLRLLSSLPTPVVAVITGEGGSGGALALGIADQVLICENAFYSVISPEGCAAILWKDRAEAPRASAALGLDARSLLRGNVVDGVIPEPPGGAHTAPAVAAGYLRDALVVALRELRAGSPAQLVARRRARFRRYGLPGDGTPASQPAMQATGAFA
jgi:acyl-CoA carboxylase subunit beta